MPKFDTYNALAVIGSLLFLLQNSFMKDQLVKIDGMNNIIGGYNIFLKNDLLQKIILLILTAHLTQSITGAIIIITIIFVLQIVL